MTDTLFQTLITTTWQSALLAAIVCVLLALFGKQLQPRFRYLLWCVVLFRLMLPILPTMPWTYPQVTQSTAPLAAPDEFADLKAGSAATRSDRINPEYRLNDPVAPAIAYVPGFHAETEVSRESERAASATQRNLNLQLLPHVALAVWFVGIVILGFRYIRDELRLYRRSRYWKQIDDPKIMALLERCRKELGIRRQVKLLAVSTGIGAAATGLFRPKILLSEQASAVAPEQLRLVLLHELIHIKRFDPLMLRLATIITLIHWFNPAAWFAAFQLQRERELACDAAVLDWIGSPHRKEYGDAVLTFAKLFSVQERLPGLVGVFQQPSIIRRIDMITSYRKSRYFHAILGGLLVLAVAGFGLTKAQTPTEPAAVPPQPGTQSPALDALDAEQPAQLYLWSSVIDAETQKPFAGVKATLYFAKPGGTEVDSRTTVSDDQGQILFPLPSELNADMEAGTIIRVEKEGYVTERNGRQAKWAERFLHEKRLVCDVFPLQKAESLTCRFVDEQGKPLADVLIAVLRQKVRPYGDEGLLRTDTHEFRSDAEGRFRFEAAKNEKVVFWAVPENLAPKYVFPDQQRGDLGDITVEKGFAPVVTVLDKDGKPVQDVWVNLSRQFEGYDIQIMTADVRSALTDQDGNARFRPVSEGDYNMRVSERPMERYYSPWGNMSVVTWRANADMHKKPVKGVYLTQAVKLSASSMMATIQAQSLVTVDVQFSEKATNSARELNTNIYAFNMEDNSSFSARSSSDSPSAYRGDGLFSFEVPVGLQNARLVLRSDTNSSYRVRMAGEEDWHKTDEVEEYSLGTIDRAMRIEVTAYKSPKITLNVVDAAGQPVKEYYAWLEYVSNGTPAKIAIKGDKIRVDITSERYREVAWDWATSALPIGGVLDVSFKYKNFGRSEAKINMNGILPDEDMRLHVVGRGYVVTSQAVPKMAEGEERELTITLTKEPAAVSP